MSHLSLVQLDIAWENKEANFRKVEALLDASPPVRDSLIVLPEMFATGFSRNLEATSQGSMLECESFLASVAQRSGCSVLGGTTRVDEAGKAYNEAVVFSASGELQRRFQKLHPIGWEKEVHTAGTEVVTFSWGGFEVAPLVCYDLRFPESFREAVRRGAELYVVIANWPVVRIGHWVTLLQARAIENQAYVVGVNRCGADPELSYCGRSLVVDPHGAIVADAGDGEKVMHVLVHPGVVEEWRRDFPALRDARW